MTVQNQPAAKARIAPAGLMFLAITSVGWGLNFPIMKHLLTEWPPLSSRGLCGVVGAGLLALIAVANVHLYLFDRPIGVRGYQHFEER